MREKIYKIVHAYEKNPSSQIYKWFMMMVIIISLIPLTIKGTNKICTYIDVVCLAIFVADFVLRWICADYKFNKFHWSSFLRYPARFISIIDLVTIFALASSVFDWFGVLKIATVLKSIRILRIFRYSKSIHTILKILKKSQKSLAAVGTLAVGYIFVSAIVIFNIEPDTFHSFFDAVYWATVSLTTVGYGDIYPVTVIGRIIAMISSFFGIAIVALPAGVVTAEYLNILKDNSDEK